MSAVYSGISKLTLTWLCAPRLYTSSGRIVRISWFIEEPSERSPKTSSTSPKMWSIRAVLNELERRTIPYTS